MVDNDNLDPLDQEQVTTDIDLVTLDLDYRAHYDSVSVISTFGVRWPAARTRWSSARASELLGWMTTNWRACRWSSALYES
jgi:hypothetical protein